MNVIVRFRHVLGVLVVLLSEYLELLIKPSSKFTTL